MDNNTGRILKQARESRGIALETIHLATKIPLDALKAIEEGYTVRTLSPFYYRGFVKMYAQFLGLDLSTLTDSPASKKTPPNVVSAKIDPVRENQEISQDIKEGFFDAVASFFTPETMRFLGKVFAFVFIGFLAVKLIGFTLHKISHHTASSIQEPKLSPKSKTKKSPSFSASEKNKSVFAEKTSAKTICQIPLSSSSSTSSTAKTRHTAGGSACSVAEIMRSLQIQ